MLLAREKLTGDNKYFCENCQSKQDAERFIQLAKLPNTLCVQVRLSCTQFLQTLSRAAACRCCLPAVAACRCCLPAVATCRCCLPCLPACLACLPAGAGSAPLGPERGCTASAVPPCAVVPWFGKGSCAKGWCCGARGVGDVESGQRHCSRRGGVVV